MLRLALSLLVLLLVLPGVPEVRADDPTAYPVTVVLRFAAQDRSGARLGGQGWQRLDGLVEEAGAAGWDRRIVVDGFRLGGVEMAGDTARVTILYRQLGWLDADEQWHPADAEGRIQSEAVTYQVHRSDGRWRIVRPDTPPRVAPGALCAISPGAPICPR